MKIKIRLKVKYTEDGGKIVSGGDERTQRKVARCIGGTPASRAKAATTAGVNDTKKTTERKTTIMWKRARVRVRY